MDSRDWLAASTDPRGRVLLVPTETSWAAHFHLDGDRLEAYEHDEDGCYTRDTYELNDTLKVTLRMRRRERLAEWQEDIRDLPPRIERLYQIAFHLSGAAQREVLDTIVILETKVSRARRHLQDYAAIPRDCDAACGCGSADHHSLPGWLEEQTWSLPV